MKRTHRANRQIPGKTPPAGGSFQRLGACCYAKQKVPNRLGLNDSSGKNARKATIVDQ